MIDRYHESLGVFAFVAVGCIAIALVSVSPAPGTDRNKKTPAVKGPNIELSHGAIAPPRMLDRHWAYMETPGFRKVWGLPSRVQEMTIYDPHAGMTEPGRWAVFLNYGPGGGQRVDVRSEQEALDVIQFIIDNDGRDDPPKER